MNLINESYASPIASPVGSPVASIQSLLAASSILQKACRLRQIQERFDNNSSAAKRQSPLYRKNRGNSDEVVFNND